MSDAVPIMPWQGGKRRLAKQLLPMFPAHECYVELFAGGAALFFLRQVPARVEVLNDINGELINLYRVVQNHQDEFVRQFNWVLSSRQSFEWLQSTKPATLTDIQRAARFFYLQRHAFAGKACKQTFGVGTTKPAANWVQIEKDLKTAKHRLNGVYIETLPWSECLKRYDRSHTFFYADPPYWQLEGYGVDFPFSEYEALSAAMRSCAGKVMVSLNDHPDIRAVFAGLHMESLDIKYSVNVDGPKAGRELVITNWDASDSGGLFHP